MIFSYLFFIFSVISIFIGDKLSYRRPWYDPLYSYLAVVVLYVSPLSIRYILNLKISGNVTYMFYDIASIFPYAVVATALANYIFYIFYLKSNPESSFNGLFRTIQGLDQQKLDFSSAGFMLLMIGLILFASMAQEKGGVLDFLLLGYGVTSYLSKNPLLATSIPIIYVSAFFFLFSYSQNKNKIHFIISIFILISIDIIEIILARRAELAVWNLAYLINFSILIYRIKFSLIAPAIVSGFLFLNFLGIVRQSNYANLDSIINRAETTQNSDENYYAYTYTLTEGQFAVPFETLPVLMKNLDASDFRYGATLFENITQWIPRLVWPGKDYGLGSWYLRKFYDPTAPPNDGRAFFYLSEGYLNFGILGIFIWAALWGWFWKAISSFRLISRDSFNANPVSSFIFSIYTANMIKLVAADSSGIFVATAKETIVWLVIGIIMAKFFRMILRS